VNGGTGYSDAARRASEVVTLHVLAHIPPGAVFPDWNGPAPWVAIRLSDGGSDGNLYPSKADAVRHQLVREQCAYIRIPPTGMNIAEAENQLKWVRALYAAGMDLADPDMQVAQPVRREEQRAVLKQIREK
jgi:hypothetical protein